MEEVTVSLTLKELKAVRFAVSADLEIVTNDIQEWGEQEATVISSALRKIEAALPDSP